MPIIPYISFFGINFVSCCYQSRLKKAYLYAFACIFNVFDYNSIKAVMDVSQFPQSIISYMISIMIGCLMSFLLVPGVSLLYSVAVWAYMIGFVKLLPLVLVYFGGLSWTELGTKILEQFGKHYVGLTIIFLFYSISISYKNLNQQVAWGTHIGIIVLILMLLNVFGFLYNIYLYLRGKITSIPNPMCEETPPTSFKAPSIDMKCK